nr:p170=170 kda DHBV pre-s region binding protein {internal fragment} [Duck hepatitis B virus, DHBV-free, hepatocyte, Peptide Partial, 13 aa] [Duck hepatitis B virus]
VEEGKVPVLNTPD